MNISGLDVNVNHFTVKSSFYRGLLCLCTIAFLFAPGFAAADCKTAKTVIREVSVKDTLERQRSAYKRAVELCPNYAEAHYELGVVLEKLAKSDLEKNYRLLDEAVKEYKSALKYDQKIYRVHEKLGDCYKLMGMFDDAEKSFSEAKSLFPNNTEIQDKLTEVARLKAQSDGPKSSDQIKQSVSSSKQTEVSTVSLMGYLASTVPKDRQTFSNILFDEWSFALNRQEAIDQLAELGKALSDPDLTRLNIVVEGHTDNRGDPDRNMELSQKRADEVKKYLESSFGISSERISSMGFGLSRPRSSNDSAESRLKNRRVEILFLQKP